MYFIIRRNKFPLLHNFTNKYYMRMFIWDFISREIKYSILNSVSSQSPIIVSIITQIPQKGNSLRVLFHYVILTRMVIKCYVNTTLKWNHPKAKGQCACKKRAIRIIALAFELQSKVPSVNTWKYNTIIPYY